MFDIENTYKDWSIIDIKDHDEVNVSMEEDIKKNTEHKTFCYKHLLYSTVNKSTSWCDKILSYLLDVEDEDYYDYELDPYKSSDYEYTDDDTDEDI